MFKYLLKRLIVSMFIVVTVVFLLMRLMPVEGYFGGRADSMTEENKQKILQNMGLLDPWYKQLLNFYDDLVHLDFGRSVTLHPKTPVVKILTKKTAVFREFRSWRHRHFAAAGLLAGRSDGTAEGRLLG